MRRVVLVFALLLAACTPASPTKGWGEVSGAAGTVPNQPGAVMECRWDLPCQPDESREFLTPGRPLRLVCTGMVDLQFVEYFHGPEPASGNAWTCPSDGTSAILLFPSASRVSFYLSAARVPASEDDRKSLSWSLSVQEWQGRWNRPDCRRNDSGVPRGQWAICGDGPRGLAIPAPTPDGSVGSGWAVAWLPRLFPRLLTAVIL